MRRWSAAGDWNELVDLLGRVVDIRAQEITVALGSFITFALVLGSYYLIRPIRENIGAEASADQRQLWFLLVFAVMLAAVPLFGWTVARLRRSLIVPGLYIFFAAMMMLFWLALGAAGSQWLRASFFVFASVFNLFVVSLFWILMSDIYESGQAKRLYGFIAAGGTTGAVLGPLMANWLAPKLGGWEPDFGRGNRAVKRGCYLFLAARRSCQRSQWGKYRCAARVPDSHVRSRKRYTRPLFVAHRVLRADGQFSLDLLLS